MKQKLNSGIQAGFYIIAGMNHFINPDSYYDLIPPYYEYPFLMNILSGAAEVLFGIGLVFKKTRKISAYGIIYMLIAFITSHVYFIQEGSCIEGALCVPEWMAWIRLIIIQPLLIYWAWSARK